MITTFKQNKNEKQKKNEKKIPFNWQDDNQNNIYFEKCCAYPRQFQNDKLINNFVIVMTKKEINI